MGITEGDNSYASPQDYAKNRAMGGPEIAPASADEPTQCPKCGRKCCSPFIGIGNSVSGADKYLERCSACGYILDEYF